jgi:hypothetical protein
MAALLKRKSPLDKRLDRVQKELAALDDDLKSLRKGGRASARSTHLKSEATAREREPAARPARAEATPRGHEVAAEGADSAERLRKAEHNERLADYLAGSFHAMRPLRHERRIQRNKAILMIIVVLLALFWVVYRFFL